MDQILADPNRQGDAMRDLYNASLKGCVSTLKTLIQRDPLILSRVSLYPFCETPLHIASLLGHLEFCVVLLHINPSLASEVDSEGRCPLHLASANGHTEIVKALLLTNSQTCFTRDKDDKLPLHFAAMRGRVGAIQQLISSMPDTIKEMNETDDGSILHLCVRYNHLETLKLLVETVRGDNQFLSIQDKEGNTVLHLAIRRRQIKIIEYLLSLSEMSTIINTLNRESLTPLDMLNHTSRDFTPLTNTIEQSLTEEGNQGSTAIVIAQPSHSQSIATAEQEDPSPNIDPPQPTQPLPSNDPQQPQQHSSSNDHLQLAHPHSSPISNDTPQPTQPSQSNYSPPPPQPSSPSQPSPTPSNNPQQPQPQLPSPPNDPSQPAHTTSPSINPLQPSPPSPTNDPSQPPSQSSPTPSIANEQVQHECSRWDMFENFCTTYLINQGNWIDKRTREQWMVAATVIATMTFQSVISPPGGVWQEDTTNGGYACPDYGFCEAGTAVVGYVWSPDFLKFIFFNSASFFASLCVVLVLISGFPLGNKVIMWILAVLMVVAITCMLLTYMWALGLVSPNHIYYRIRNLAYILVGIWSFLLFAVVLIQTTRVVFWVRSWGSSSTNNDAAQSQNSPGHLNN